MTLDAAQFKQRQRAMWATGDYANIGRHIQPVAVEVVEAAGIGPGDEVLDVATGSGNAALLAAQRGARVTGLDLTPEQLELARARATEAGLEISLIEGDAQELPFAEDSFDRVTSVFGVMFAPDQERAAAELLRVCRPGGTIVVSGWTREGYSGQMFGVLARHLPPLPEGSHPPMLWGSEERVRELFAGAEVTCERRPALGAVEAESVEAWIDYNERLWGPLVLTKRTLEAEGRWPAARADLVALSERFNEATDGSLRINTEYLLTVVRKPG